MRSIIRNPSMKWTILGSGGAMFMVIVLILAGLFLTANHQDEMLDAVNLAGQQRMLAQKVTKDLLLYQGQADDEHLKNLKSSMALFDATLKAFLEGTTTPATLDPKNATRRHVSFHHPEVKVQFQRVQAIWQTLVAQLATISENTANFDAIKEQLIHDSLTLPMEMNQVVELLLQRVKDHNKNLLHMVAVGVLAGLLCLLLILWQFRVTTRKIDSILEQLGQLKLGRFITRVDVVLGSANELDWIAVATNDLVSSFAKNTRRMTLSSKTVGACGTALTAALEILQRDGDRNLQVINDVVAANADVTNNVRNIHGVIQQTSDAIIAVTDATAKVADDVRAVSDSVEETSQSVCLVTTDADMINLNIGDLKEGQEKIKNSVAIVTSAVEDMNQSMQEVLSSCQSAIEQSQSAIRQVRETEILMERFKGTAQEIGQVVTTISDISDQTNMLALNANIEAAGAGDAGLGFSVVANEVKELAKQTSEAIKWISKNADDIQDRTSDATKDVHKISGAIEKIDHAIQEINASTTSQADISKRINHAIEDVLQLLQEAFNLFQEIEESAQSVSKYSGESSESTKTAAHLARNVAESGTEMAESGKNLQLTSESILSANESIQVVSQQISDKVQNAFKMITLSSSSIQHAAILIDELEKISQNLQKANRFASETLEPFDIQAVKSASLQWLSRLTGNFQGYEEFPEEEVADIHSCGFGQWYDLQGKEIFGESPLFREIGQLHVQMHGLGVETLQHVKQNELDALAQKLKTLDKVRVQLFDLLDRAYLSETLQ